MEPTQKVEDMEGVQGGQQEHSCDRSNRRLRWEQHRPTSFRAMLLANITTANIPFMKLQYYEKLYEN
jgi:hypothetical protein